MLAWGSSPFVYLCTEICMGATSARRRLEMSVGCGDIHLNISCFCSDPLGLLQDPSDPDYRPNYSDDEELSKITFSDWNFVMMYLA